MLLLVPLRRVSTRSSQQPFYSPPWTSTASRNHTSHVNDDIYYDSDIPYDKLPRLPKSEVFEGNHLFVRLSPRCYSD